jgi:hypothetical protein
MPPVTTPRQPMGRLSVAPVQAKLNTQKRIPPAVYKPQPLPRCLQLKPPTARIITTTQQKTAATPAAPPVYQPDRTAKVLQRTPTSASRLVKQKVDHRRIAPPVYKPNALPAVLQTKKAQIHNPTDRPAVQNRQPENSRHKPNTFSPPHLVRGLAGAGVVQQRTGSASNARSVIQRMVINLDMNDPTIDKAAVIEGRRQTQALGFNVIVVTGQPQATSTSSSSAAVASASTATASSSGSAGSGGAGRLPLLNLRVNEPLTLLAHGVPAFGDEPPKVAGMSPRQLYDHLISLGLTTAFVGVINLSNCTTAWGRNGEPSFGDQFVEILRANGHRNPVTGFRSFVSSLNDRAEIEVAYDQREISLAIFMAGRYISFLDQYSRADDAEKRVIRASMASAEESLADESRKLLDRFLRYRTLGLVDENLRKLVMYYAELKQVLVDFRFETRRGKERRDFWMFYMEKIQALTRGLQGKMAQRIVPADRVTFAEPVPVLPAPFWDNYDPGIPGFNFIRQEPPAPPRRPAGRLTIL